jgi:hypothetical protein
MTTLGWLGWRSIWAPPKGGEAATVPCMLIKTEYPTFCSQEFCRLPLLLFWYMHDKEFTFHKSVPKVRQ